MADLAVGANMQRTFPGKGGCVESPCMMHRRKHQWKFHREEVESIYRREYASSVEYAIVYITVI